jgi:hypothetical protein
VTIIPKILLTPLKHRIFLGLLSAVRCFAGLEWTTTTVEMKAAAGQTVAEAAFPFRNAGPTTVWIDAVRPDCDCVSARTAKPDYAAGEEGEVRVAFALAGRSGLQEKTVAVTTTDDLKKPVRLTLHVLIAEPVAIAPRSLFWAVGGPADEKAITITLAEPAKTTLGEVQCSSSAFAARLESGDKPGAYRLCLKPADTRQIAQATIRLNVIVAGRPQVFVLWAAVK